MYKSTTNLIGFLGADAKVQAAQDCGNNFTTLSLATQESWKNRDSGEWESRTEWHRIVAFGKLGEFAATLKKGAHIEVEGTLRSHERTVDLVGGTKSNPKTHMYRTWSIRADSIRKLDRAERVSADKPEPESDTAE